VPHVDKRDGVVREGGDDKQKNQQGKHVVYSRADEATNKIVTLGRMTSLSDARHVRLVVAHVKHGLRNTARRQKHSIATLIKSPTFVY
jgi:hypothetical protein